VTDQEGDKVPATVPVGHSDTGRVLGHQMHGVRQRRRQGEDDRYGHFAKSDGALLAEVTGGFWILERDQPTIKNPPLRYDESDMAVAPAVAA
jgi:hypothetical protein